MLDLSYTPITDDAIAGLVRCRAWSGWNCSGTTSPGRGLERLSDLPNLRQVNLAGVDPEEVLTGLTKLRQLESVVMWVDIGSGDIGSHGSFSRLSHLSRLGPCGSVALSQTRTWPI